MKKLTRLISMFLVCCLLAALFPAAASDNQGLPETDTPSILAEMELTAQTADVLALTETVSGTCGAALTWTLSTDGTLTIGGTGAMADYSSASPAPWFGYRESITNVLIGSGAVTIGIQAFASCGALISISIPASVSLIDEGAFYGCGSLSNVHFDGTEAQWDEVIVADFNDDLLFAEVICADAPIASGTCGAALTWALSADGTLSISGTGAMPDYSSASPAPWNEHRETITCAVINSGVTSIGKRAFANCSALTAVTIPASVTAIAAGAFYYCGSLTAVNYGGMQEQWSRVSIGDYNDALLAAEISCTGLPIASGTCGTGITWKLSSDGVLSISGTGTLSRYNDSYSDDAPWMPYVDSIVSLIIGEGITEISKQTFAGCTSITEVELPESLTTIWYDAFSGCIALTSVTIPENVTNVYGSAFLNCTGLSELTINCTTDAVIAANAFKGCSGLTRLTIGDGLTTLDGFDFTDHPNLEYVKLGNGITQIPESAFENFTSLREVILGDTIQYIFPRAFAGCTALTEITIPAGSYRHVSVGDYAFDGCTALTSVSLHRISHICDYAFNGCVSLKNLILGPSLDHIFSYAFNGCTSLTEITLPRTFTWLEPFAFNGCTGLTSITLPAYANNVTSVSYSSANMGTAFSGCSNLTSILVAEGNSTFCSVDGVLYSADQKTLIAYPAGKADSSFAIPNTVTAIGDYAFYGCQYLEAITIPDTVTSLGDHAFSGCSKLNNVVIPGIIRTISRYAFSDCSNLSNITIPNGVTGIAQSAFENCTALREITIPASVTSMGLEYNHDNGYYAYYYHGAFYGCENLENIIVSGDNTSYQSQNGVLFSKDGSTLLLYPHGRSQAVYEIPDTVSTIYAGAFDRCTALSEVYIPNSVTIIEAFAFANCVNLNSITIPDSVTAIRERAFSNCTSLESVTIPGSVVFGNYVQYPNTGIFENCTGLTSVTIEEGPTILPFRMFSGCTGLTSVSLPVSLTWITENAFLDCSALEKVYFNGTEAHWETVTIASGNTPLYNAQLICSPSQAIVTDLTATVPDPGAPLLTWTAVLDADRYEIWYHDDTTNVFDLLASVSETEYLHSAAGANTKYTYKVRAVFGSEYGPFSTSVEAVSGHLHIVPWGPSVANTSYDNPVISWTTVSGAVAYELWCSTTGKDADYSRLTSTSATSYTHTSAKVGCTYYYKLRIKYADGYSPFSEPNVTGRVLDRPNFGLVKNDEGYPRLYWYPIPSATFYEIRYSTSEDGEFVKLGTTTDCEFIHTTGIAGFTYYYKVFAAAGEVYSTYSLVRSTYCSAPKPSFTLTLNANSRPTLDWEPAENITEYRVYYSYDNKAYTLLWSGTETEFTHTSASLGQTYSYKILFLMGDKESEYSEIQSIACTCCVPTLTISPDASGLPVLSWNTVDNATSYEVYRSIKKDRDFTMLWSGTDTELTDTAVYGNGTYYYKIRAICGSNAAANSALSDVTPFTYTATLDVPMFTRKTDIPSGKPCLSWEHVEGAEEYEIWRCFYGNSEGGYTKVGTTTSNTFIDSSAEPGFAYNYRVRARAGEAYSKFCGDASGGIVCQLGQAQITVGLSDAGYPVLMWGSVYKAESYIISRSTSKNGDYTQVWEGTALEWTDTSARSGTTYYYKVHSVPDSSLHFLDGVDSEVVSCTCYSSLSAPSPTVSNLPDSGQPRLSWRTIKGAAKYEIWRSTSETGTYTRIYTTKYINYTDSTAISCTTYYYKIRAVNGEVVSEFSKPISCTCALAQPTVKATLKSGQPRLSWSAVDGAAKYEIWRSTSESGTYTRIYTTKYVNYTDSSAVSGVTYFYKVRAINGDITGIHSTVVSCQCLNSLAAPTVTVRNVKESGQPRLSWSAVDGAAKYEIWRSTGEGETYTRIYTTKYVNYTDSSAIPGTTYCYKVRAINGETVGEYSEVISCKCLDFLEAPAVTIRNVKESGKPRLSWSAVDGAAKYEIWRSTEEDGTYAKIYTTKYVNYTDSSAESASGYYYMVRAINGTAVGEFCAPVYRTCDLPQPTVTTSIRDGKPRLSWSAVDGAEKYEIWRSTSQNGTYTRIYTTKYVNYTDSTAETGMTYYYKVRAVCSVSAAAGAYSSIVSVTAS